MSYQYGTKRCPVCEARIRAAFCSSTCREADCKGITREAQLAIEMNRRPWSSLTIASPTQKGRALAWRGNPSHP